MAHINSIFSQFLSLVPRQIFSKLARKHTTGRKERKFSRWSQFVSLMFIQIAERKSLRAGIRNIKAMRSKSYHLGLGKVARSTFSDANNKRPAMFFKELFDHVLDRASKITKGHKFRFKNALFSLDATTIDLNKNSFPWAEFRKNKSGIKLHTLLDHNGYLPSLVDMTKAKTADVQVGRKIKFNKGDIVIFDKGYNDYDWYEELTSNGVFFVTRLKTNADYAVIKRHPVKGSITSDQVIKLKKTGLILRRIGLKDKDTGKHYQFLTNNFRLAASTIGGIYKDRWAIGVSSQGHINQSVKVRPRIKDSNLVAWEAPWREAKMVKPSDKILVMENMQSFRPQRTVNVDVASLHANPVAETVDNVRRQQEPYEMSLVQWFPPAGYQRWHGAKVYVETGEALGIRWRNPAEEASPITLNGKWMSRYQGGGLGRSTNDRCAAKRTSREGPRLMSTPGLICEAGVI